MSKNLFPQGRKLKFETPEQLEVMVVDYLTNGRKPSTITGMCISLGFESRQSFYDYEKREEYTYVVKRARLCIEALYEEALFNSSHPSGAIFALKNFGWRDDRTINLIDERAATAELFPEEFRGTNGAEGTEDVDDENSKSEFSASS